MNKCLKVLCLILTNYFYNQMLFDFRSCCRSIFTIQILQSSLNLSVFKFAIVNLFIWIMNVVWYNNK